MVAGHTEIGANTRIFPFATAGLPQLPSSDSTLPFGMFNFRISGLRVDPANLRPGGIVSGPTVFGVCDAALYFAAFTIIGLEPMALTSELSIRFLRPAFGEEVRARATIDHCGRRSVIGTITAWTTDPAKPCAVAQGTYVRPNAS